MIGHIRGHIKDKLKLDEKLIGKGSEDFLVAPDLLRLLASKMS